MTWKKTNTILNTQLNRRGLANSVIAGQICRQAEQLFPGQFVAISLRAGVLHLRLNHAQLLAFKLIEGKLFREINTFATTQNLPEIRRIRLTISEELAIL